MLETKAWEVDTCRGHYNNISVCLFHPHQELIISNGEDKTIRIWDTSKRTALQTFRRETDRFWTLTAHPELNLFAAGHDSGLIVFKLERERPPFAISMDNCYYIKDKMIRSFNFLTQQDVPLIAFRRGQVGQSFPPRTLSYNPSEHSVIVCSANDGGSYEMYSLPRSETGSTSEATPKRGSGSSSLFVARNRFVVLDKGVLFVLIM
jgi:coatomer protein complex subunit alpha (xenin)